MRQRKTEYDGDIWRGVYVGERTEVILRGRGKALHLRVLLAKGYFRPYTATADVGGVATLRSLARAILDATEDV